MSSSSSSSPSSSSPLPGSGQVLSASDPNTWPEPMRPPSPLPSASSSQSSTSASSLSSLPSVSIRSALDPAVLNSAVRSWLDEHGAAIIADWLSAHGESLLQRARTGGDSTARKSDSTRMEDVEEQQPAAAVDTRGLGLTPRRNSPVASSSSLSPSAPMSGESEDFTEVDPRKMLASRNRQRINDMQGHVGLGSVGYSSASSQPQHTTAVDRIKDSPIAEEGATVQELGKQPLHIGPQSGGSKTRGPGGGAGAGGSGPDVLLVEDNRVSQKIAQQALTRAHYKVEVASDGETAVEKYRQHASSLRIVLMDVGLPGISGTEASEKIRKLQHDAANDEVLIYGLTGNVAEANLRQYEQAGMNGCIVKGKLIVDAVKQAVEMSERNPHEFVNLSGTAVRAASAAADDEQMTDAAAPGPLASPRSATDAQVFRPAPRASPTAASSPSTSISPTAASSSASASSPSSSPSTSAVARPSYQPGSSSGPDLLLVEDVRVSQRVAQAALQRVQFRVEVASDGESAVDKYRQLHSSLRIILMDVGLPGISGIEATEIIRAQEREYGVKDTDAVLIFGLTGNVEQENLREYEQVGMNGCIVKGRLIADAVKQAIDETSRRPGQFINLVGKADIAAVAAAAASSSPTSSPQAAGRADFPAAAASPSSPLSMSGVGPTLPDDDDVIVAPSDRAAALRNASSSSSASESIGTPRAIYPRQLLRERFPGSGVTRAGVGLPGAGAAAGGAGGAAGGGGGSPTGSLSTPSLTSASGGLGVRSISGGHHGPDVLLVEDVRVSQKIAQQALTRAHYKVEVASDGETAVEKYRQHASSLRIVLMDVGLPGISGIEATERIRAMEAARVDRGDDDSRPVWIFGLTGNVAESNLRQYEQAGMNGCIVKGQLLVDAVKLAVERVERDDRQFVNLSAADSAGVRGR